MEPSGDDTGPDSWLNENGVRRVWPRVMTAYLHQHAQVNGVRMRSTVSSGTYGPMTRYEYHAGDVERIRDRLDTDDPPVLLRSTHPRVDALISVGVPLALVLVVVFFVMRALD